MNKIKENNIPYVETGVSTIDILKLIFQTFY